MCNVNSKDIEVTLSNVNGVTRERGMARHHFIFVHSLQVKKFGTAGKIDKKLLTLFLSGMK